MRVWEITSKTTADPALDRIQKRKDQIKLKQKKIKTRSFAKARGIGRTVLERGKIL